MISPSKKNYKTKTKINIHNKHKYILLRFESILKVQLPTLLSSSQVVPLDSDSASALRVPAAQPSRAASVLPEGHTAPHYLQCVQLGDGTRGRGVPCDTFFLERTPMTFI